LKLIDNINNFFKKKFRIVNTNDLFKIQSKMWYASWEDEAYRLNGTNVFSLYESDRWLDIREVYEKLSNNRITYNKE